MAFTKAVKRDAKLRMSISGPSGAGKSWTAFTLATRMAEGAAFAVIDTERGSASKYADDFSFDVQELENFDPRTYVKAIHEAEEAGYSVLVIDSLTHAWNGTGGLLDLVEAIARRKYSGNTFAAWKDATPIQNALIDAITSTKLHIIVTMRSKQEYSSEKDDRGKTQVKKLGMAPIQRDGMEYELDIAVDMDIDNTMIVQKSRCSKLAGQIIPKPDGKVADVLKEWLRGAPALETPRTPQASVAESQPAQASAAPKAAAEIPPMTDEQRTTINALRKQLGQEPLTRNLNTNQAANVINNLNTMVAAKAKENKPATPQAQPKAGQLTANAIHGAPPIERIIASANRVYKDDGGYASLKGFFVAKHELGDIPDSDIPANIRIEMADMLREEAEKKQPVTV